MTTASMIFRGDAKSLEASATSGAAAVGRVEKSARGVGPAFKGANREVESFGKSIKHIATLTLGTLGAAELVKGIKDSINAAGDLEKQQRKVIRVFGETPKVLEAFEKSSAKSYGVSHLAALKAATSTGALLKNLGIGTKVAAGMSVGIVKLSSDIASFNGLPTAVVADRVNKALLGQTRGLKSLGIALSQADVNAKAFAIGLVKPVKSADAMRAAQDRVTVSTQKYGLAVRDHGKTSKEALAAEAALIKSDAALDKAREGSIPKLTAQQQALATYALILERSKKQQGDFARNSDTLANEQKTLDATFADLSDRLGEDLTPAMKALVEFMAGPGITAAGHFLTSVETDSRKVYDAVKPLAPAAHAAADGLSAIAHADGVIPTLIGTAAAYKGVTLALRGGQSAYASAAGAIGNLASPFRTVSIAAADAGNVMVGAGFTGQIVSAASVAEREAPAFLGLANPIAAIGVVAAAAVGGLILLSTTTESAGEKARKARDDFLGLADAVDKVKSTKLDVQQSRLDVQTAQQAIQKFSPTLVSTREAARQAFPDTAAGDRQAAAAKDRLSSALLRNKQLYLDLARSKQRLTDATNAEGKAEADQKAKVDTTASAFDGLRKKLLDQAAAFNVGAIRSGQWNKQQEAGASAASGVAAEIGKLTGATKGLSPAQRTAVGLIQSFISETGKIPDKKTFKLLVDDAASGKIAAVKRDLDELPVTKTISVSINERLQHPFNPPNPLTGRAAGDIIDRPQLAMVGEEAPAHPEFIIPTNPARRGRALGLISQMRSWIPGFAGGGGPSDRVAAQERAAIASTPGRAPKKAASRSSASTKPKDNRPAWLKAFEDGGNKLPGDDAFANAIARAQADLADATGTPAKADNIAALHHLIRLASKRLPTLHAFRNTHKEAVWQTAVNTQISSVTGQAAGYRSTLADLLHKPSPDEIQLAIPGNIQWAIERAGFTDSPADDIAAQKAKAKWLTKQIAAAPAGAKKTALKRELARTNAELASLKAGQAQSAQDAADAAEQAAETPPDVPTSIQEQLADAALTTDTGDDLAALQAEQAFLQQAIADEANPTARIALKESLAGVNDQIAGLTDQGGTAAAQGPTQDEQAVSAQLQQRLDVATRSAALSEAELRTLSGSGDIGTGRFGNALGAGSGVPQLSWSTPASTTQVASAAAQGFGSQPAVSATRQFAGI